MTDVIFSFDTEDFTSATAADAIYREAELLRTEGVRGGFCIVGLLAEQLKNWGRTDIVKALEHHDILTHSYGHSLHPTLNEYTDTEDFDVAYAEMIRQEAKAVEMIREVTGATALLGACPPGNQKSYVAMYGYADMGLPIYSDTFCDTADGEGVFFCNIYQTQYTRSLESALMHATREDMSTLLDKLADHKRVILYTHPNMALYTEFWDALNYYKENLCEFGKWKECARRPIEETERFYDNIRTLIRMIKADARFRITSYSELAKTLAAEPQRVIERSDLPAIGEALKKELAPIRTPVSLSVSDIFLACKEFLCGADRHVCGRVYGFLDAPYAIEHDVTLRGEDVIASAKEIDTERFLPSEIVVGGVKVGPADWLRAALDVIAGCETVTVSPGAQLPSPDILPQLKNLSFRGQWVQSDRFEDRYLSDRLRYQSWTMRFLSEF